MKTAAVLSLASLASTALAQPRHAHKHLHNKREPAVAYVTEWETVQVTEYIDATSTVWITPGQPTPTSATSSSAIGALFHQSSSVSSSSSSSFVQPTPSPSSSSTSVFVPPSSSSSSSVYVAPSPTTLTTVIAPSPSTSSSEVVVEPTPAYTTSAAPAAATTSTSAAAAPSANSDTSSSGGGSGTQYTGDMTYYALGLGSCGVDDSGLDFSANIVAISVDQMSKSLCGKSITITANGKSFPATIHDTCMGCASGAIDVNEGLFVDIFGSTSVGRSAVSWQFN